MDKAEIFRLIGNQDGMVQIDIFEFHLAPLASGLVPESLATGNDELEQLCQKAWQCTPLDEAVAEVLSSVKGVS